MQKAICLALAAGVILMAVAHAWTCDDAFITFRVAEQLLGGHGPVFNIGERVQVFTHPLWLFAVAAWAGAGGSLFPGAMGFSVAVFAAGVGFLFAALRDRPVGFAVAALLLMLSRAAMDYATSGLETPLSFTLLAAAFFGLRTGRPRFALTMLALLPLNRLDLLPVALPFAFVAAGPAWRARMGAMALACAPAAAWIAFSTIYYGAPLPNTALVKLGGALAGRLDQGASFLVASFITDPGALASLVLGVAGAVRLLRDRDAESTQDRRIGLAAATAAALAFAYVLWCGGDFMLGRFILPVVWTLVLVVALAIVPPRVEARHGRRRVAGALAVLAAAHLITGQSATHLWLRLPGNDALRSLGYAGAVDERRFYAGVFGLHSPERLDLATLPRPPADGTMIHVVGTAGVAGYLERREQAVVDVFALLDPLAARVVPLPNSRPGHGYRAALPESWRWREAAYRFPDGEIDKFARRLRLAHLSPELWTVERWRAIAWLASRPAIELPALAVRNREGRIVIDLDPELLYRHRFKVESFKVWLRVYDEEARRADTHITPAFEYTRMLDRDCRETRIAADGDRELAFDVPRHTRVTITCPAALIERDGILMRVGAVVLVKGEPRVHFDEGIAIVRPPWRWWLDSVPRWALDGWRSRPWPPVGVAALLLLTALALRYRRALPRAQDDHTENMESHGEH